MDPTPQHIDRQIRVFISSTFRDMQKERDILIKKIFPQLRKLCEERAVTWTEIDLRWGITAEQSAEGQVLPLCLAEIERCRPWFIGLLGERYGWVPDSISADLIESQNWLREHLQNSVTELEIQHGVLRAPAMAGQSLFYFRDPHYVDRLPRDADRNDFVSESPDAARKLERLKNKIREAHAAGRLPFAPRENYFDPEVLGQQVLTDFTAIIEKLYPQTQVPVLLDQESARHEAYAQSRRLAFVGRDDLVSRLDEHISTPRPPLVLTGDSGCGKSALLAEWVNRWRQRHPQSLIVQHYIGSTPGSADWQEVVRRILGELKRAFSITDEIPVDPDALRSALHSWTGKVPCSRRVVLVLDGLNQLADDGAARQLPWLPDNYPDHFRVLVSTLSGESLEVLRDRQWAELRVPLLVADDIAPAAIAYFKVFSKTPAQDILAQLMSTPAARNALYLRAVLDELRQFGKHEELQAKAADYLAAPNSKALYDRILARWEHDFGRDLVRDSLSLIWSSRRGLSEAELADLLGHDSQPLPRATWTPLYLAAEYSFAQRVGLLTFFHNHVREAVQERYLPDERRRTEAHARLADYFATCSTESRRLDELPWQLVKAWRWTQLHDYLLDLDSVEALWQSNEFDLKMYWTRLEKHSPHQATNAYFSTATVANATGLRLRTLAHIGRLLYDTGRLNEARQGMELLVQHCRELGDTVCLQESLGILGITLGSLLQYDQALAALREREQICRRLGDLPGVQVARGPQAVILQKRGEVQEAERVFHESEAYYRQHGDLNGLQNCLGDQSVLYMDIGQNDKVRALQAEEERLCRQLGNRDGLGRSLMNKSRLLLEAGELERAWSAARNAESIHRDIGDRLYLTRDLKNLGDICQARKEFQSATMFYAEGEQLCWDLNNQSGAFAFILDQGRACAAGGQQSSAVPLLRRAADAFPPGVSNIRLQALEALAAIRRTQEDVRATIELNRELILEYRELGNHQAVAANLFSAGALHCTADAYDLTTARNLLHEALQLCELHDLQDLRARIVPFLEQVEQRPRSSVSAKSPCLDKTALVGHSVADFQIQKLHSVHSGTAVYQAIDVFRERPCRLKVGKDNELWSAGIEALDELTNLREQVPAIEESFRGRLASVQKSSWWFRDKQARLWFDGQPDILVASWNIVESRPTMGINGATMRLILVNEPRQRPEALSLREIDALAAKHDIPFAMSSVRAAYGEIFMGFIAAIGQKDDKYRLLTKETVLLLADKPLMNKIGTWIIDMDKRRRSGQNADALQAVQNLIATMNFASYLPLADNLLVLLLGLQSSGAIGPQQMLDTLYSKEAYYNLSPQHVEQLEALTSWIRQATVPESIVSNYEWLCHEAAQLVDRKHSIQNEHVTLSRIRLLKAPPCDLDNPALCMEYGDPSVPQ